MSRHAYPVALTPDDGTVMASFPDLFTPDFGGGFTAGDDTGAALAEAEDLLETIIGHMMAEGLAVPEPSPAEGRPLVALSPMTAIKLALYCVMRETGVTKAELARRLGWHFGQVARLLDPPHHSRLEQLQKAFAALGKRMVVDLVDSPAPDAVTIPPRMLEEVVTGRIDPD